MVLCGRIGPNGACKLIGLVPDCHVIYKRCADPRKRQVVGDDEGPEMAKATLSAFRNRKRMVSHNGEDGFSLHVFWHGATTA
jgi:hypothetical protein